MRDSHDVNTESTSPPNKKKRKQNQEEEVHSIDTDNDDNISVDDLSFKLEDMEIDPFEEEIVSELSKQMDDKIKEKEKKNEEEEHMLKTKLKDVEYKKRKAADIKANKAQQLKKKQKQRKTDIKKKEKKKMKMNEDEKVDKNQILLPNIRDVPKNCKHLVKDGDMVYVVPGDGCCGPNCAAAFLFQDEVFGPKLRKKMNLFFAKHWYDRYQYVSQCSKGHPFSRKVRNGEVKSFTDPKELIKHQRKIGFIQIQSLNSSQN